MRILTNRWVHFLLLFGLLLCARWFGLSETDLRKDLQHMAFDSLNKTYPREIADQDKVIIADIDDESLLALGQWPWPRTVYIDLLSNLQKMGATVVAFDGVLAEPDGSSPRALAKILPQADNIEPLRAALSTLPDPDEEFAKAIKQSKIFVTGFTHSTYSQSPKRPKVKSGILARKYVKKSFLNRANPFVKAATFLPVLEKAAAGNGSFMASADHDGIVRQTGLIFSDRKQLYPSLSLEALRVGLGIRENLKIVDREKEWHEFQTEYRLELGKRNIPLEKDGKMNVYYRHFDRQKDYIPVIHIVDEAYHDQVKERIAGRIVFIGASAEGLKDLRNTAIQTFRPGVEIHANATEQIIQEEYLLRPDIAKLYEQSFISIAGFLMIVLAPFINAVIMAFFCAGFIGFTVVGAYYAFVEYGVLIDYVYPSLSVFFIFVLSIILTYIRTEFERKQVRDAFGLYISPDFMKELTSDPDKLALGGENKDLSVMFSDIRNFTTISEGLTPQELIQLMNDFLTPMSDLVMQNRGTIDKYMGDAMMAFWNAPLDDAEHAMNACRTALQMNDALVPINEAVKLKAEELGKEPVFLNAGIGINTGPCAVGNMGSKQRFAYSTLGDAVNLASRLEGQTKNYGVNILIGYETYKAVPDFAALEFDLIQVKGKTEPVRIFALLGDEGIAQGASYQTLKQNHDAMIKAYRNKEFEKAIGLCETCKDLKDWNLNVFYDLYITRARDLLKTPPPKEWDGVFVATSK